MCGIIVKDYAGGQSFRANDADPSIDSDAATLIQSIGGLDDLQFSHSGLPKNALAQTSGTHAEATAGAPLANGTGAPTGFHNVCFKTPATLHYTTSGGFPKADYTGTIYDGSQAGCGYTPQDITTAYGLDKLYAQGWNGAGQTIVVMESCGSNTVVGDANAFSKAYGLPELTSANYATLEYPLPSECRGIDPTANLVVEWAHAIAPGANILHFVTPDSSAETIDEATFYAVNYRLGTVVSGNYWFPEGGLFISKAIAEQENLVAETASVLGIATNYPSGNAAEYVGTFLAPGLQVSLPGSLPYATSIGGVSAGLNADGSLAFQIGWETRVSELVQSGNLLDPVGLVGHALGFQYGSGGGHSIYFDKPAWQSALPGKRRLVPDISWLADPTTGAIISISENTIPSRIWVTYGGTELSTTMFSALWAIASQAAGTPLGQAAPYLYRMPQNTISDVLPASETGDATGTIYLNKTQDEHLNVANAAGDLQFVHRLSPAKTVLYADTLSDLFDISFGVNY